jgi:hypothetical protein
LGNFQRENKGYRLPIAYPFSRIWLTSNSGSTGQKTGKGLSGCAGKKFYIFLSGDYNNKVRFYRLEKIEKILDHRYERKKLQLVAAKESQC